MEKVILKPEPVLVTPEISEFRLSFIRVDSFSRLIDPAAPLGFLSTPELFAAKYLSYLKGEAEVKFPFSADHFWQRYLGAINLRQVSPRSAVSHLLPPVESGLLKLILPALPEVKTWVNGYSWPHGSGVVLSLRVGKQMKLEEVGDLGALLRHARLFAIPGNLKQLKNLDEVMDSAMAVLNRNTRKVDPADVQGKLFSVVTFIARRTEGCVANDNLDSLFSKVMNSLLTFKYDWQEETVNPSEIILGNIQEEARELDSTTPGARGVVPGHAIFHAKRGRVVWFPENFIDSVVLKKSEINHRNGCYHNNLTSLSMQIEGLGALVETIFRKLKQGRLVSSSMDAYGTYAVMNLVNLYKGEGTYRSTSAKEQMTANNMLPTLNSLCEGYGLAGIEPQKQVKKEPETKQYIDS
ncbi:MAG TPA: hypothetical protein PK040_02830 [Anaerolineaceae bacterium]|nr:hypothetical protein [Anaerolineaceae bacterium]